MQNEQQREIFSLNQHISLARAYQNQPSSEAMEWAFDQPASHEGENNRSTIRGRINESMQLAAQGKIDLAIAALTRLLADEEERAVIHNNLGVLYQNSGEIKRGARHFRCALNLNPHFDSALINLGNCLSQQGDLTAAEALYKQALALHGPSPKLLANLGHCLLEANRLTEAEEVLGQSIASHHGISATHYHLVRLYLIEGRIQEAEKILRLILKAEPLVGTVQRMLANCIRFTPGCQELQDLQSLLRTCPKHSPHRLHLAFALGKAYEDIQQPEKSFRHITLANALLRRERPYQRDIQRARFLANQRLFTASFQSRTIPSSCQSNQRVVFLIGLPRCGSTLVHQILSMHPNVEACGESTALGNAVLKEKAGNLACNPQSIARIRDAYLCAHANPSKVLVDKNLYNFYWAPIIFKAFPKAVVIEITREKPGHYWSLYKNYFSHGNEFTSSLEWIDEFMGWYDQLLEYWRKDIGLSIPQIRYEELVADTQGEVSRLLNLCGLSWDPACLQHEKSKAPVLTASACQVRQGVYNSSIKGASLYQPMISRVLQGSGI